MGESIDFKTQNGSCKGYLAKPASGKGPGVIVLQEWWGLVDHIKDVTDRFASAGFTALAPDLYHGECACHADQAGGMMMGLDAQKTEADLGGAIQFLRALPETGAGKVGVVGYCMGGQLAMVASCSNPEDVGACVNYYGVHPAFQPKLEKLQAPVLGFFAGKDGFVTPEVVAKLEAQLNEAGKIADFKIFADADHAFFNDTRPEVYHADYAKQSWEKTLTFLHQQIG